MTWPRARRKFATPAPSLLPRQWQTVLHCPCDFLLCPFKEHKRKAPSPGSRKETGQHKEKLIALTHSQTIARRESIQVSLQKKLELKGKKEKTLLGGDARRKRATSAGTWALRGVRTSGWLSLRWLLAARPPSLAHM